MLAGFSLTNSIFSRDYILKKAKILPHASYGPVISTSDLGIQVLSTSRVVYQPLESVFYCLFVKYPIW